VKLSIFSVYLILLKSYDLRNRSILRLLIVGILFLIYDGSMCYFNYYVHQINEEVVTIYYSQYKRYVMLLSLSLILQESIKTGNKQLACNNPNPNNHEYYLMDAVNAIIDATAKEQEFIKTAQKSVYKNYLDLFKKADSDDFCNVSDSYNAFQTIPCSKYYEGPLDQGLTAAFSFYTEYFTKYSYIVQNANLSDPNIQFLLQRDPQTTFMGIFITDKF